MFGYIKIFPEQLKLGEARAYKSVYCALCHQIAHYSQFARLFLSFDMVFLTILSAYDKRELAAVCDKRHCLKRMPCPSVLMDFWAAMSIIIIYHKLLNDVNDGAVLKRLYVWDLKSAYTKARQSYPDAEETVASALRQIDALERNLERDPEKTMRIFGNLAGDLVDAAPCGERSDSLRSVIRRIAESIGNWVYAMDFYDDLEKDQREGQYNPLLLQQADSGDSLSDIRRRFQPVIEKHVEELQRLCSFLPYEGFHDIVTNVLHEGVIHTTEQVCRRHASQAPAGDRRRCK